MRSLLVLDCDEVILQFARPFQLWLEEARSIILKFDDFSLMGNLRHKADGSVVDPLEVPVLLDEFFLHGQDLQQPTEGVVEALALLSRDVDVTILTNIPEEGREKRVAVLRSHGIDFPVISNRGPKGRRLAQLTAGRRALFVDDIPRHHESAAKHAPTVWRLHMVADERLRGLIPPAPQAHARIDNWAEAGPWIHEKLEGNAP